jgi:hypothetical protein
VCSSVAVSPSAPMKDRGLTRSSDPFLVCCHQAGGGAENTPLFCRLLTEPPPVSRARCQPLPKDSRPGPFAALPRSHRLRSSPPYPILCSAHPGRSGPAQSGPPRKPQALSTQSHRKSRSAPKAQIETSVAFCGMVCLRATGLGFLGDSRLRERSLVFSPAPPFTGRASRRTRPPARYSRATKRARGIYRRTIHTLRQTFLCRVFSEVRTKKGTKNTPGSV